MSLENVNIVRAMIQFTAANPPVVLSSRGVKLVGGTINRSGAGAYNFNLSSPLGDGAATTAQMQTRYQVTSTAGISGQATFTAAAPGTVNGEGGVLVEARNLAGAAADTLAVLSVTVYELPSNS